MWGQQNFVTKSWWGLIIGNFYVWIDWCQPHLHALNRFSDRGNATFKNCGSPSIGLCWASCWVALVRTSVTLKALPVLLCFVSLSGDFTILSWSNDSQTSLCWFRYKSTAGTDCGCGANTKGKFAMCNTLSDDDICPTKRKYTWVSKDEYFATATITFIYVNSK